MCISFLYFLVYNLWSGTVALRLFMITLKIDIFFILTKCDFVGTLSISKKGKYHLVIILIGLFKL